EEKGINNCLRPVLKAVAITFVLLASLDSLFSVCACRSSRTAEEFIYFSPLNRLPPIQAFLLNR
ncbi:hypothetical protein L9F63_026437, partial [Diploptera punctata]